MKTISEKAQYYVIPMKIRFFFCLHSPPTPVSGHPMHNNWLLAMKFVFILQINKNMTFTEQQNSRDQFCQISICPQKNQSRT